MFFQVCFLYRGFFVFEFILFLVLDVLNLTDLWADFTLLWALVTLAVISVHAFVLDLVWEEGSRAVFDVGSMSYTCSSAPLPRPNNTNSLLGS
jgi:hypothetical protein